MYLEEFAKSLESMWKGSLLTVKEAESLNERAKEYLYRLEKAGRIERVCWGWYFLPTDMKDPWAFLVEDRGFKVLIKQTASSFWNYDFVHRNVYRLAVENSSYKKALEEFAKKRGWIFEVEQYKDLGEKFDYQPIDGLFVERPYSCIVNCVADWSFLDAFATLYFRRGRVPLKRLKGLGRWKRISKTNVRVWTAIKYGCKLFNEYLGERTFNVRDTRLDREDVKELVEEAVEKVVEFA
ncbi:hypothetical protein IBX38_09235 [Candidatus Bathyarchaeota archaeon]|nr:hypothetical protein [Candidatus Bathyarchaeota archaeon]